ncbi:hypothetical protein ACQPZJ_25855 [Actinoplanes sp. CA-054009]
MFDFCALPTAERPLRLAEFDQLFAAAGEVDHWDATHARLRLAGAEGLAATVRHLTAREAECCSFFTFTVTEDGSTVILDVEVPPGRADVLAALVGRAR